MTTYPILHNLAKALILTALPCAFIQAAQADTVVMNFNAAKSYSDHRLYTESGFTLKANPGKVRINDAFSPDDNAAQPSFGFGQGLNSRFTLTSNATAPFSIKAIDLLEATVFPKPYGITFIGTKADASIVKHTFKLDGVAGKQTFTFSSDFSGLVSLKMTEDVTNGFSTDVIQIDNVVLSTGNESISSSATGLSVQEVTCANLTTGNSVQITPANEIFWDCEKAGLVANPEDQVVITIDGHAK